MNLSSNSNPALLLPKMRSSNPAPAFAILLALIVSLVACKQVAGTPTTALIATRATVAPETPIFPMVRTLQRLPSALVLFQLFTFLDGRDLCNLQALFHGIHQAILRQARNKQTLPQKEILWIGTRGHGTGRMFYQCRYFCRKQGKQALPPPSPFLYSCIFLFPSGFSPSSPLRHVYLCFLFFPLPLPLD